ncbi:MAG TPA: hypothetical protein GX504_08500 [Clostridia bacterium]|nr:hypothetical protein [Clostridia bacterium]
MKNPCGTAKARIYEQEEVNGLVVYFGSGASPVNSPAQFFVAWGKQVLAQGFLPTYNKDTPEEGHLWFVEEEEAEAKYRDMVASLQRGMSQ